MAFDYKTDSFFENLQPVWGKLKTHQVLTLATSSNNRVSARLVSVIIYNGKFYFQTDENYLKFRQLSENPNAAFVFQNYSIEGRCRCIGNPTNEQNSFFLDLFRKHFKVAFELYSELETERLIEFTPTLVYCWGYDNSKPFMEYWDFEKQEYHKEYQ